MTRVDRSRLPDVGPDPPFTFPDVVRHTLASGLEVRTIEHHSVPVITFVLQVDGGSGSDAAGEEGLAAITADMVDEGTGMLSAIEVSDALARLGAEYDVDVGADATVFSLTTLTRFADRGAGIFADLLTRPSLRQDDFDRVKQLRLDRLRQLKDLPPAVAERAFLRLLYGTHPYGHLAIGDEASLAGLTLAQVASFHRQRFIPSRSSLVVGGAMSHDELLVLAEQAFGDWADEGMLNGAAAAAADIRPADSGKHIAIVAREGAAQSELRIGHLSARRDTPDYPALIVMNAVLGGQFVSRVNLKLREEKGYTYGAAAGFDFRRGRGPFTMRTAVETSVTVPALLEARRQVESPLHEPVTQRELDDARNYLRGTFPLRFGAAAPVSATVAGLSVIGLNVEELDRYRDAVTAVDAAAVTQVALDLSREAERIVVVGDAAQIAEPLRAEGFVVTVEPAIPA